MSEDDIPDQVLVEILEVLNLMKAHKDHSWEEVPGLYAAYSKWRDIINERKFLEGTFTQRSIPGLSAYGELFLLKYSTKLKAKALPGRPKDKTIDPAQDKRIKDAWDSGNWRTYAQLAENLGLPEREVRLAI